MVVPLVFFLLLVVLFFVSFGWSKLRRWWAGRKTKEVRPCVVPAVKYVLHPGPVVSKNDGQVHHIGVARLMELYRLRPGEYVVFDETMPRSYNEAKHLGAARVVHLYPLEDGKYGRPEVEES